MGELSAVCVLRGNAELGVLSNRSEHMSSLYTKAEVTAWSERKGEKRKFLLWPDRVVVALQGTGSVE